MTFYTSFISPTNCYTHALKKWHAYARLTISFYSYTLHPLFVLYLMMFLFVIKQGSTYRIYRLKIHPL